MPKLKMTQEQIDGRLKAELAMTIGAHLGPHHPVEDKVQQQIDDKATDLAGKTFVLLADLIPETRYTDMFRIAFSVGEAVGKAWEPIYPRFRVTRSP